MRAMSSPPWFVIDGPVPSVHVTTPESPAHPSYGVAVHIGPFDERVNLYGPSVEAIAAGLEALAAQVRAAHVSVAA